MFAPTVPKASEKSTICRDIFELTLAINRSNAKHAGKGWLLDRMWCGCLLFINLMLCRVWRHLFRAYETSTGLSSVSFYNPKPQSKLSGSCDRLQQHLIFSFQNCLIKYFIEYPVYGTAVK